MWNVNEAKQAAHNLALLLEHAENDDAARQIVHDYNIVLLALPSAVRAIFFNEFAATASHKALSRFFKATAAEQDAE